MRNGDLVVGVPSSEDMRKEHENVVGEYDKATVKFMGKVHIIEFVVVEGVSVSCDDIRPATRRDQRTVL